MRRSADHEQNGLYNKTRSYLPSYAARCRKPVPEQEDVKLEGSPIETTIFLPFPLSPYIDHTMAGLAGSFAACSSRTWSSC